MLAVRPFVKIGLLALTVLGGLGALSTIARANFNGTYDIAPLNFAPVGGCTDCGDVIISGDGTTAITVDIKITGSQLQIHGSTTTVAYNLASLPTSPTLSFDAVTNGTVWSTTVQTAGVGNMDGFGGYNVGINCNGALAGNLCGTEVKFTLTSTNNQILTLNDKDHFLAMKLTNTDANGLCADGCPNVAGSSATGFATLTAQPVPGPIVGAGLPGLVAACAGLIGLARRRRRRRHPV
jgi:hypothetical protein